MKPNCKTSPHFQAIARTLFAAIAVLACSTAYLFAAEVNVTYATGSEVPIKSNGFTAAGKSVNFRLDYAPTPGTQLMVVQNTGSDLIKGTFSNLAQGQIVALSYAGMTFHFVANYYGGKGRDLVLLWTSDEHLPAAAMKKLDTQIVLALKQSRGEAPFNKPTSLAPDIPAKIDGRVLVDIRASVSKELLDQLALVGGRIINESVTATTVQALLPLSQLETLAGRADIKSISPARPTITSEIKP